MLLQWLLGISVFSFVTWNMLGLFYTVSTHKIIQIKESGNFPVRRKQNAVILYTNLFNCHPSPVYVEVNVGVCCIFIGTGTDCEVMRLLGSYKGEIGANKTCHVNFVYPTVYPYNLTGACELHIRGKHKHKIQRHVIIFNTMQHNTYSQYGDTMWKILQDLIFGELIPPPCLYEDEDKFNRCQPVNCVLKYHGYKNYFDPVQRKCVKVPHCIDDGIMSQAYDEISNICKDLNIILSSQDKSELKKTHKTESKSHMKEPFDWRKTDVICVHGNRTTEGYGCVCDDSWYSSPVVFTDINPDIYVFKLCDQRLKTWTDGPTVSFDIALITVSVLCGSLMITLISFLIFYKFQAVKTVHISTEDTKDNLNLSPVKKRTFWGNIRKMFKAKFKDYKVRELGSNSVALMLDPEDVEYIQDYELE